MARTGTSLQAAPPTNVRPWADSLWCRSQASCLRAGPAAPLTIPNVIESPNSRVRIGAAVTGYREEIGVICGDTFGVTCGPNLHELLDPTLDFEAGDIHPNTSGHAKIAAALAESILAVPEPSTGLLLGLAFSTISIRLFDNTHPG